MNATYFISVWVVLGVATLILAIYRHILTVHQEEDVVHLADSEQGEIAKQTMLARRLTTIDTWGKSLTIIVTDHWPGAGDRVSVSSLGKPESWTEQLLPHEYA